MSNVNAFVLTDDPPPDIDSSLPSSSPPSSAPAYTVHDGTVSGYPGILAESLSDLTLLCSSLSIAPFVHPPPPHPVDQRLTLNYVPSSQRAARKARSSALYVDHLCIAILFHHYAHINLATLCPLHPFHLPTRKFNQLLTSLVSHLLPISTVWSSLNHQSTVTHPPPHSRSPTHQIIPVATIPHAFPLVYLSRLILMTFCHLPPMSMDPIHAYLCQIMLYHSCNSLIAPSFMFLLGCHYLLWISFLFM